MSFLGSLARTAALITDPGALGRMKREISRKIFSFTKRGPGRQHRSGHVRPAMRLPPFGIDRKGNVITELPDKYMHSAARKGRAAQRLSRAVPE